MKKSEKAALTSFALSAVATTGGYYALKSFNLPWWAWALIFLSVAGSCYSGLLKDEANKRLADGE